GSTRRTPVPGEALPLPSRRTTAREIIAARAVVTHFQPIYSAKQKSIVGVEALSRGRNPATAEIVPPAELFALARAEQLDLELEDLCRDTALRTFAAMHDTAPGIVGSDPSRAGRAGCAEGLILFMNVDAERSGAPAARNGLLFLNFD